jgi:hypothetical protein
MIKLRVSKRELLEMMGIVLSGNIDEYESCMPFVVGRSFEEPTFPN